MKRRAGRTNYGLVLIEQQRFSPRSRIVPPPGHRVASIDGEIRTTNSSSPGSTSTAQRSSGKSNVTSTSSLKLRPSSSRIPSVCRAIATGSGRSSCAPLARARGSVVEFVLTALSPHCGLDCAGQCYRFDRPFEQRNVAQRVHKFPTPSNERTLLLMAGGHNEGQVGPRGLFNPTGLASLAARRFGWNLAAAFPTGTSTSIRSAGSFFSYSGELRARWLDRGEAI